MAKQDLHDERREKGLAALVAAGIAIDAPTIASIASLKDAIGKSPEADIAAGKLHPFTGPMKDNAGKERLAAGKAITDGDLSKMDYYVEGVVGKLPTSK